jgi:hypothetical protein
MMSVGGLNMSASRPGPLFLEEEAAEHPQSRLSPASEEKAGKKRTGWSRFGFQIPERLVDGSPGSSTRPRTSCTVSRHVT